MNKNNTKDMELIINMNNLYKTLMDKVDIGIHVINNEGKTIIYNKKMMEIESMSTEDVLNKNLLDVFKFKENQHRSEEHTSELQSRFDIVCRLLLEKNTL